MTYSSLLVCKEDASAQVLRRVLEELHIQVESSGDSARAAMRLAQERFDLIILDCESQADVVALLREMRQSRSNDATLAVAVVPGQESIREMFSLGVNFVLYKPVSYERALSSLRAAQALLGKDKRRNPRAPVHTQATIDYSDVAQANATLVDLAEDGMAVHFGQKFPPTCKVYFQFQLPGQTASVRLSGQVVWQDWNGRAGIQFVNVPQASRRVLREWLRVSMQNAPKQQPLPSVEVEVEHSIAAPEGHAAVETPREPVAKVPIAKANVPANSNVKSKTEASEENTPAASHPDPGDRRGETRYPCRIGAEVYTSGTSVRNYCHLSDLSSGGCYLEIPLAFPAGTRVEIVVRTQEIKMHLSGEVMSSHPGYGMSISFSLENKSDRDGVQQLIDFVAATAESSS